MRLPPRTTPTGRTQARVALALLAAHRGYALVETFETDGTPTDLDHALAIVEDLALTLDADALAVTGKLDHDAVEELAARTRLLVLRHPRPPTAPAAPATTRPHPPHPQEPR
jgi:hypothetical protein